MKKIIYFLLIIPIGVLFGCVQDEKEIFDDPTAIRVQKAVKEYTDLLTSSENGWFADFYPENNHAIGGYAMYLKFTSNGKVDVGCEIATNAPAREIYTSEWDVFAEQSVVLRFSSYNPVVHFFSEPYASNVNGRNGDYEFVIQKATADQIDMIGKKHGNKLTFRKNTSNISPEEYFKAVSQTEEALSAYGMFSFVLKDSRIGVTSVTDRTFTIGYTEKDEDGKDVSKTTKIAYTFTPTGIRLYEPFEFSDVNMQNFDWKTQDEKYICADSGVNAYFDVYFPPDYELRYSELVGTWELRFHGASTSVWETRTATIVEKKKNATLQLICDDLFNFPGVEISFDAQKGIISILNQNAAVDEVTGHFIRICSYDRVAGYLATASTGPIGIVGDWNKDAGGVRSITFKDNGRWGTYHPDGFLVRLYSTANVYIANFVDKTNDYRYNNITITKIN